MTFSDFDVRERSRTGETHCVSGQLQPIGADQLVSRLVPDGHWGSG